MLEVDNLIREEVPHHLNVGNVAVTLPQSELAHFVFEFLHLCLELPHWAQVSIDLCLELSVLELSRLNEGIFLPDFLVEVFNFSSQLHQLLRYIFSRSYEYSKSDKLTLCTSWALCFQCLYEYLHNFNKRGLQLGSGLRDVSLGISLLRLLSMLRHYIDEYAQRFEHSVVFSRTAAITRQEIFESKGILRQIWSQLICYQQLQIFISLKKSKSKGRIAYTVQGGSKSSESLLPESNLRIFLSGLLFLFCDFCSRIC